MRQLITTLILFIMSAFSNIIAQSQHLNFEKLKEIEHQLEDVMEMMDTSEVKRKINETETATSILGSYANCPAFHFMRTRQWRRRRFGWDQH